MSITCGTNHPRAVEIKTKLGCEFLGRGARVGKGALFGPFLAHRATPGGRVKQTLGRSDQPLLGLVMALCGCMLRRACRHMCHRKAARWFRPHRPPLSLSSLFIAVRRRASPRRRARARAASRLDQAASNMSASSLCPFALLSVVRRRASLQLWAGNLCHVWGHWVRRGAGLRSACRRLHGPFGRAGRLRLRGPPPPPVVRPPPLGCDSDTPRSVRSGIGAVRCFSPEHRQD